MAKTRSGADAFLEQLVAADVRWMFGNPGSTEHAIIDALQDYDGIDLVLALHESVAVGAAEGYARASGRVGVVELHAGPGLGNGLGMLYNARVGQTPMVVYVGQSEQQTLYLEPILSGDFITLASPIAKWAHEVRSADEIPQVLRRAFKVADTAPRGPVVVSVPMDLADAPCTAPVWPPSYVRTAVRPDAAAVAEAAEVLLGAEAPAIIVGDGVATAGAVAEVGQLARLIGAPIFSGTASEVCVDPDEELRAARLPYEGKAAEQLLEGYDVVVAVGTRVLAQIFPFPGPPLGTRRVVHIGLDPWELAKNQPSTIVFGNERAALEELTDRVRGALSEDRRAACARRRAQIEAALGEARRRAREADRAGWDASPMSPARAVAELASALPAEASLVDEALTASEAVARHFSLRPGHWFRARGGAIGGGVPMAIGVQLARPGTTVAALSGDGSAMYTISALWTAAHHKLPIIWAILNNRSYRILKENTLSHRRSGVGGRRFVGADLTEPDIDFVSIARGMGVDACCATEPGEIAAAVQRAVANSTPTLIDMVVSGFSRKG